MTSPQHSAYERANRLSAGLLAFQLGREADTMTAMAETAASGRAAKTIVKEGPLRLTLVALRAGVDVEAHRVAGGVCVQALRGSVRLTTDSGEVTLPAQSLAVLEPGLSHRLHANEASVLLLTIQMEKETELPAHLAEA